MAVDAVLALGITAVLGSAWLAAPVALGCGLVAAACVAIKHLRMRLLMLCLVANACSALRARDRVHEYDLERARALKALPTPARCSGTGSVVRSPVLRDRQLAYTVEAANIECDSGRSLSAVRVRLYGGPKGLKRGDEIRFVAGLGVRNAFANFGRVDPALAAARRMEILSGSALAVEVLPSPASLPSLIDQARNHVRERILSTFSPAAEQLARALVLGESDLEKEDQTAFNQSGLAHLLAVSGTHLVFAILSLVRALELLLVRIELLAQRLDVRRLAAAAGVMLALLYADFAGGSGSAERAAWMLSVGLGVRACERRPKAERALGFSLLIGALLDPLVLFDVSFVLSVLATVGLLSFGKIWTKSALALDNRLVRYAAVSGAATVSATVLCLPCLALLSERHTFAGVLANVIAAPLGEVIALPVCLAHGLLAFYPDLEQGFAVLGSGALLVVKAIAHASAANEKLAFTVPLPNAWQMVSLGVGGLGFWLARAEQVKGSSLRACMWQRILGRDVLWVTASAFSLLVIESTAQKLSARAQRLTVTMSDVAQGDAIFVDLPDGKLMLIDGGGFPKSSFDLADRVLSPYLRAERRSRIDIMVLSHPHPDHYLGLLQLIERIPVGELWHTGQANARAKGSDYQRLLYEARERGVTTRTLADLCFYDHRFGGAAVRVLDPCPRVVATASINDNSMVLQMQYGKHTLLFLGDAEAGQEQRLVEAYGPRLRADLLKIAHHGSATSTTRSLLAEVLPGVALISVGVRNRFGHPNPAVLERLEQVSALVRRTDRQGAIRWSSDGEQIRLTSMVDGRWYAQRDAFSPLAARPDP